MNEDLKLKIEEIKYYLLDFQRVIDDNYSLFENLHLLLSLEEKTTVSLYHEEIHDLFYAIFSFYCQPLYRTDIYYSNADTSKIATHKIWANGKEEFSNKKLFIEFCTNCGSDREYISRHFTEFDDHKYDYSKYLTGKKHLTDVRHLIFGFSPADRCEISVNPHNLWHNFTTILSHKNQSGHKSELLLPKICSLYLDQGFNYSSKPTYQQYLDKYKVKMAVNNKVTNSNKEKKESKTKNEINKEKLQSLLKYPKYMSSEDKFLSDIETYINRNKYNIAILAMIMFEADVARKKPKAFKAWLSEFCDACNVVEIPQYTTSKLRKLYSEDVKIMESIFCYLI